MKRTLFASSLCFAAASGALLLSSSGCGRQQPVAMAPPVSAPPPQQAAQGTGGVYQWRDVPVGQQVPINRAVFDQGGYQLYAQTGDTIVVPFVNENLYVMKFGQSGTGQMYFVQDGSVPTLYVPRGAGIENANAQGARWYPFSQDYQYQRPVYVGIAPSWSAFTGMGWYPGMSYYGGYWGYNPYGFSPMAGIVFNIGGRPYYGWNSYTSYYRSTPGYIRPVRSFNYASTGRTAPGSFGRNRGSGSFGSSRTGSGGFSSARPGFGGGTGSFSSSRTSGGFSSSRPGSGSFGSSNRSTFGSGSSSSGSSSSGSSGSSGFGSFGRRSGGSGSFGSSSSGSSGYSTFGSGRSSSGGSFGSGSFGRSSSGSSGGFGRSSSGSSGGFGRSSSGGSFGGGRSSGGFGGGRRR